jgi:hypothetical protein
MTLVISLKNSENYPEVEFLVFLLPKKYSHIPAGVLQVSGAWT